MCERESRPLLPAAASAPVHTRSPVSSGLCRSGRRENNSGKRERESGERERARTHSK